MLDPDFHAPSSPVDSSNGAPIRARMVRFRALGGGSVGTVETGVGTVKSIVGTVETVETGRGDMSPHFSLPVPTVSTVSTMLFTVSTPVPTVSTLRSQCPQKGLPLIRVRWPATAFECIPDIVTQEPPCVDRPRPPWPHVRTSPREKRY